MVSASHALKDQSPGSVLRCCSYNAFVSGHANRSSNWLFVSFNCFAIEWYVLGLTNLRPLETVIRATFLFLKIYQPLYSPLSRK